MVKNVQNNWDWRNANPPVLTPIQDQGQCNDCWAFSATGAIESLTAIQSNTSVVGLSMQALTSCTAGTTGCTGCSTCGGTPQGGFAYVISNGGLATNGTYPFVGFTTNQPYPKTSTASCNTSLAKKTMVTISNYCNIPANSVSALQSAVAYQPVSVAVDATSPVFQYYQGGIITGGDCGSSIDHAVLAVGYNTTAPTPYWIVKNQWGTQWGDEGYVLISTATSGQGVTSEGVCGILSYSSIPIKTSMIKG